MKMYLQRMPVQWVIGSKIRNSKTVSNIKRSRIMHV